jgi:hypothetical protein
MCVKNLERLEEEKKWREIIDSYTKRPDSPYIDSAEDPKADGKRVTPAMFHQFMSAFGGQWTDGYR